MLPAIRMRCWPWAGEAGGGWPLHNSPDRPTPAKGCFDALLVFEHEGHDEIGDKVEPGRHETEVDERQPHLFGLRTLSLQPTSCRPESLVLELRLDGVASWALVIRGTLSEATPQQLVPDGAR